MPMAPPPAPAPVVMTAPAPQPAMTKAVIVLNSTDRCIKIRDTSDGKPAQEYQPGYGRQVASFESIRVSSMAGSCDTTFTWSDKANNVVSVVCR
jgi:hypothetical protein